MDSIWADLANEFSKPDQPSDPVKWAEQVAGLHLWSKQREILDSVRDHKLTAVQSAHGTGKSMLASILAAWWICTHPYDDTIVISTAPSKNQVHGILWENIRRIHRDANLPGVVQLSDNWIINRVLVGQGRKPQDYSQHAFQGIHAKYVLFILDEACGINKWIWTSAITNTTSEDCRVLAIGNPDDPSSEFARICRPGSGWNNIRISVWDSPKFTLEDPEIYEDSSLVDQTYVETAKREWGEGSPVWQSKVEGLFPLLDDFAVIPKGWILKAFERWHLYQEVPEEVNPDLPPPRKILGVDVARMGDDKTVVATRIGDIITECEEFSKMDTVDTANIVMARMNKGRDKAIIDMTGLGSGVYDIIKSRGYKVEAFNAGARTDLTDTTRQLKFTRVRSAAWWKMRDALDPAKEPTIALPPDTRNNKLEADLSTPRWEHTLNGQIQVEGKDDIRKRLNASTDYADAVIMAWFAKPHVVEHLDEASFSWHDGADANDGAFNWDLDPDWRDKIDEQSIFTSTDTTIPFIT